tara:strand:+ start:1522 stop:1659 length:138 start_codon:yes stop_codon:yes gene_type:complete
MTLKTSVFMPNLTRYKAPQKHKPGYLLLAILITTNSLAFYAGVIL